MTYSWYIAVSLFIRTVVGLALSLILGTCAMFVIRTLFAVAARGLVQSRVHILLVLRNRRRRRTGGIHPMGQLGEFPGIQEDSPHHPGRSPAGRAGRRVGRLLLQGSSDRFSDAVDRQSGNLHGYLRRGIRGEPRRHAGRTLLAQSPRMVAGAAAFAAPAALRNHEGCPYVRCDAPQIDFIAS